MERGSSGPLGHRNGGTGAKDPCLPPPRWPLRSGDARNGIHHTDQDTHTRSPLKGAARRLGAARRVGPPADDAHLRFPRRRRNDHRRRRQSIHRLRRRHRSLERRVGPPGGRRRGAGAGGAADARLEPVHECADGAARRAARRAPVRRQRGPRQLPRGGPRGGAQARARGETERATPGRARGVPRAPARRARARPRTARSSTSSSFRCSSRSANGLRPAPIAIGTVEIWNSSTRPWISGSDSPASKEKSSELGSESPDWSDRSASSCEPRSVTRTSSRSPARTPSFRASGVPE